MIINTDKDYSKTIKNQQQHTQSYSSVGTFRYALWVTNYACRRAERRWNVGAKDAAYSLLSSLISSLNIAS